MSENMFETAPESLSSVIETPTPPVAGRKSGFVAIAGRPNAGKSTITNALLGTQLSIVTPKAQTTRERVHGVLTEKQGQIVFIDTPGIHNAKEGGINAFMMSEVRNALEEPDLIWYIVDPQTALKHEEVVLDLLKWAKCPIFILFNKTDVRHCRVALETLEPILLAAAKERGITFAENFHLSALKQKGMAPLMKRTWRALPVGPFHFEDEEQISDRPQRYFVGEKIREQLFYKLGEEVPYCCAISIDKFDESADPLRIEAVIHVERESQKGMVIGANGAKIKEIGTAARKAIEAFIGVKIFLGLSVKVLKDWSKDAEQLRKLGYDLPPGLTKKKN